MTGKKQGFATDWLPFGSLIIPPEYQREVIQAHLRNLKAEWRLEDVGAVAVAIRKDGRAYVIDGGHRTRAAMELGLADTKVLCHVYRGLTVQEEAQKFLALNDAKKVTAVDRYKAGLVAQDPQCLEIRAILAKHGLAVGTANGEGSVRCVSQIIHLHDLGPELLDEVCDVLVESWGTRPSALDRIPFAAVGIVIDTYNGELDKGVLVKKLGKYSGGPSALVGDARGLSEYRPITLSRAAAQIVVDTYNKGRGAGSLSPL